MWRLIGGVLLANAAGLISPALHAAAPAAGFTSIGRPLIEQLAAGQNVFDGPVWSVLSLQGGDLVVGSNRLSLYTGQHWQSIPLPGAHAFRALDVTEDGRRVWVGARHEIGFLTLTAPGQWTYQSLMDEWRRDTLTTAGDVWAVQATANGSLWMTSDRVARWDGHTFQSWRAQGSGRLIGAIGGGRLWYYDEGIGLFALGAEGEPELVVADADLPNPPVRWILPPSADDPSLLLGLGRGAYRREPDGRLDFLVELSLKLGDALPTKAVRLPDGDLAIATFTAGVVIADREGRVREIIDRSRGLFDNTIYTLAAYQDHLWIGYQGGLARVDGVGSTYLIDRQTGLGDGMPRSVQFGPSDTWVLTSKDAFRRPRPGSQFQPTLNNQALLWSARSVGNALWVGGLGGVWRIENNSVRREHYSATDVTNLATTANFPSGVLFVDGYRLKVLRPSSRGGWVPQDLGVTARDTPVSLFESSTGDVWLGTMSSGIDRYAWRQDATGNTQLYLAEHYDPGQQLPAGANRARLTELAGEIYAFTDVGITRLDPARRRFVIEPNLADFIGVAAAPVPTADSAYWLVYPRRLTNADEACLIRVSLDHGNLIYRPLHAHGLRSVGNPASLQLGDDALWLSGADGILRIAESSLTRAAAAPELQLHLLVDGTTVSLAAAPSKSAAPSLQLAADVRRIEFRFPPVAHDFDRVHLQTRLVGADEAWSRPDASVSQAYSGLAPGTYRFEARSVDPFGRRGPVASADFVLMAPWYLRAPALAAAVLALAALVAAIMRWRVRQLHRRNENLNLLVEERTRQLALSNIAKSDFLENISHEIRNPLNGLNGLLSLLKEDNLGTRERELTRSLRAVANKLMGVFEDVLSFSRLEYGYVNLEPQPFLLRPLLEETVDLFAVQFEQQNQTLTLDWPEDLRDGFTGDHAKIRTIIDNLVSNALKYAPGSPVTIAVLHDPDENARDRVELQIEVADQGPGIPPEEQVLVFAKFARGSTAKRKRVSGTGLGLATCRALAQLMGGEIMLNSSVGQGSQFTLVVTLPRSEVAAATTAGPTVCALPDRAEGPVHALIVEDEPYNQIVLEGLALELGYLADLASTVGEALEKISARSYGIIFLDWELPDAPGIDVAHAVRGSPAGAQTIILATTAHDSEVIRERCRQAGMDAFLLKPYDTGTVRNLIASVGSARAAHRQREATAIAAAPESPAEPFNRQAFSHYSRVRGEHDAVAVEHFVHTLDQECAAIDAELERLEPAQAKFHAHRLRALAGLIGARELNLAAKHLEDDLAQAVERADWAAAWKRTRSAVAALKQHLHATLS